ncbi:piggyBac transposable element-derived protein 3-like [Anastrepha obliqua]|uniref:piggyBac transposable element-derived protein 3-like n=1 Tax=Anastrepha obliqua TaxID=95512 RepID=UPI00240930ED|nr:piggyBac transposable element-derived protein 3-like [Anastrepha obliqua]
MRPKEKGLSDDDIERIVNFDWDASSDDESDDEMDAISAVLEKNLEGIVQRGETIQVFDLITQQTDLYALQEHGIELKCTVEDIKRYIGILLYMGVLKLPQLKMAWSKDLNLTAITDSMPRGKFEKIKQCLHFNDNTKQSKKGDLNYDKLYKIRPLLDSLKENFGKLPQEEHQSIDEQIIAFKGRSSFKQYNPAKPHKWGLKMFTRAGTSGLVYDFTLYVGEGTCPAYGLGLSSDIVLYLAKGLPKDKHFKLYFDNWFTSVSLLISLKEMGIFATGTVRKNRISNCQLLSDAELKKRGRGSFDMKCEINNNILCVKWFDNKPVPLISSCESNEPVGICKRWNPKEKAYIDVARPAIVASYNKGMGGVDLADMLMELYKVNHRSNKCVFPRLINPSLPANATTTTSAKPEPTMPARAATRTTSAQPEPTMPARTATTTTSARAKPTTATLSPNLCQA